MRLQVQAKVEVQVQDGVHWKVSRWIVLSGSQRFSRSARQLILQVLTQFQVSLEGQRQKEGPSGPHVRYMYALK